MITPTEELILEKVKFGCSVILGAEALDSMTMEERTEMFSQRIIYQFRILILGETVRKITQDVHFKYPATPWEHLKHVLREWGYCPRWLRRRLTVRKIEWTQGVTFKQIEYIPKFARVLPKEEQEGRFTVLQNHLEYSPQPFSEEL